MNDTYSTLEEYTYIPKKNPWRDFVTEMWFKHKDEVLLWSGKPVTDYDMKDYFRKNKWFLKQQYKNIKDINV